jgi:hypothetical protein
LQEISIGSKIVGKKGKRKCKSDAGVMTLTFFFETDGENEAASALSIMSVRLLKSIFMLKVSTSGTEVLSVPSVHGL